MKPVARLGKADIPLQIDLGTGDAVTPEPVEADFPTLLDFPAPHVRAYPAYTVVAEKFEAMVSLGVRNTRMPFHSPDACARTFMSSLMVNGTGGSWGIHDCQVGQLACGRS